VAKILKIAAIVVSIAAAIPTGGTSLLAAGLGVSAAAASAIAVGVSVAAGVIGQLTAKKPAVAGVQTSWTADPDAPIPIIFGRCIASGDIRYRKQHGNKNKWDTLVSVLSGCGPIQAIDQTYMEKAPISFSSGVYTIDGHARIWQRTQLGACPEPSYLAPLVGAPPQWTSAHKLSGYAAVLNTFEYDATGDHTLTSTPRFNWLIRGVKAYDPRLDSSYPGGAGPQRWNDQTTWTYSRNPYILGLTWAIGWRQGPDKVRVGGVGMDISGIDVAAYVDAANIADLHGWTVNGRATTGDDKWEVLKSLCQAGGGEPVRHGALLSCFVNAPRVSIATIGRGDIIGTASVQTAQTFRDRVNGVTPRYTSEDHFWEQVPAGTIRNATFLAADGAERTKTVAYPMVTCEAGQTPDQAAQLAGYDIVNAREAQPITLPLKLRWLGYRAGDCLTIAPDLTELGWLAGRDVVIVKRELDPATAQVVLTVRTEDPNKHDWALTRTGTAAPITGKTTPAPDVPMSADTTAIKADSTDRTADGS